MKTHDAAAVRTSRDAHRSVAGTQITIRGVTKRFRSKRGEVTALDNVSLDIGSSDRVVLLGPSGCGKTTLLRCVAGLETPDEGEICIGDTVVYSSSQGIFVPPEHRDISMMFQSYALWPHMTVFQNIAFPLENRGTSKAEIAENVKDALALVACSGLEGRYPAQLSGGQQQRIALARAIVANDSVILFDEPLSNVDAKVREQLRVELVALQRRFGFSALYVTHDQTEATAVADRIAVFDSGRLVQVGTPREIYSNPDTSSVAEFVGSTNRLSGSIVSVSDGLVQLDTAIGKVVARLPHRDLGGGNVTLHFRPEHVKIGGPGTFGSSLNLFDVELETEMFLGNCTEYSVLVGTERLILRTMSSDQLTEGDVLTISIDPDQIQVYPARTS